MALISNLGEDGGRLFEGGGALIPKGALIISQMVARRDHFSDTSSAYRHQHELFIDIKS